MNISYFFLYFGILRALHSFPTRRSSDLIIPNHLGLGLTLLSPRRAASLQPIPRSEEHTSELQSRQYLVCRLLLEKKKQPGARPPLRPPLRLDRRRRCEDEVRAPVS